MLITPKQRASVSLDSEALALCFGVDYTFLFKIGSVCQVEIFDMINTSVNKYIVKFKIAIWNIIEM